MHPPITRTTDGTAEYTSQRFTLADIWRDLVRAIPRRARVTVDPFEALRWPSGVTP